MHGCPAGFATTSKATSAETTDNAPDTGEEFDTFLRLLTAQIKNQDPLEPLESTQFVEQLATFSGLELQANANNILEDIAAMLAQQTYGPLPPASARANAEIKSTLL